MAGLVPAIHVFSNKNKAWMPGTRPGMTRKNYVGAFDFTSLYTTESISA